MAVAAVPKSVWRKDHSITEGNATIPAYEEEDGTIYWGLPGGVKTTDPVVVRQMAKALNREIERRMTDIRQLLHVDPKKALKI